MNTIKDGGPAFPCSQRRDEKYMDEGGYGRTRTVTVNAGGMTLRDYFAGQVLSQMIGWCQTDEGWDPSNVAENAYQLADAMLAAREAQP